MNYWENDDIKDASFEEVSQEIEDYLDGIKAEGEQANIMFAPLSESRWELVAFFGDMQMAYIDSVYVTPQVAKQVMTKYKDVGMMELH